MRILILGSAPNKTVERIAIHFTSDVNRKNKNELDLVIREDRKNYFIQKKIFKTVFGLTDDVFNLETEHAIALANRLNNDLYHYIVIVRPEVKKDHAFDNVIGFAQALNSRQLIIMDQNLEAHPVKRLKKKRSIEEMIGDHWDESTHFPLPERVRFWQSPYILTHINRLLTGDPQKNYIDLIRSRSNNRVFDRAVSVGCGSGGLEINLVKSGIVKGFDLFDLSPKRIAQGEKSARELGVSQAIRFYKSDPFDSIEPGSVDLVFWHSSLHHMPDAGAAIEWSFKILKNGGMFYMNDFVGPSRFQWSDNLLSNANRIRGSIPGRYFKNPYSNDGILPREIKRPNPGLVRLNDPSEAADSSRILSSLLNYFPGAEIIRLGGIVYYLVLNDVLHNYDESTPADRDALDQLLKQDEAFAQNPEEENLYAAAVAFKN